MTIEHHSQIPNIKRETTLGALKRGDLGIVTGIGGSPSFRRRLREMGLVDGTRIQVLEAAPFGDPMKVHIPHYVLALRKRDAALIQVRPAASRLVGEQEA